MVGSTAAAAASLSASFSSSSCFLSRGAAAAAAALPLIMVALIATTISSVQGQSVSFCDGQPGQAEPWACDTLAPIPDGTFVDFLALPGNADAANPVKYKQVRAITSIPIINDGYSWYIGVVRAAFRRCLYFCVFSHTGHHRKLQLRTINNIIIRL